MGVAALATWLVIGWDVSLAVVTALATLSVTDWDVSLAGVAIGHSQ